MPPRIETLTYEIRWLTPGFQIFPTKQNLVVGEFDCTIEASLLSARPRVALATEAEARSALEPHLQAWALEIELERGHQIEFRIVGSHAETGAAEPGEPRGHIMGIHEYVATTDSVQATVQTSFPHPTGTYRASADVNTYLARLRDLRAEREKAPACAYALLTDLEQTFGSGNRATVAAKLGVSVNMLVKVGQLSSGNHPLHGRKVSGTQPLLTDADLVWLNRAVQVLVRRAVAVMSGATSLPQITVADV